MQIWLYKASSLKSFLAGKKIWKISALCKFIANFIFMLELHMNKNIITEKISQKVVNGSLRYLRCLLKVD